MAAPLIILSESTVASYGTVGALYRDTFAAMGVAATLASYPSGVARLPRGAIVIHNTLGFRFTPFPGVRNIAVPFHEWSRYPPEWAHRLNAFDEVWAATPYLASLFAAAGVSVPIRLAPPALDVNPPIARQRWATAPPFRLLFVGEPHFRKGHHLLIEGFRRLGAPPGRATLTLKTSPDCAWRVGVAGIRLVAARWPLWRMRRLYAAHDAFISASLGEGLGLGVAEAMLARVPVATNRWGGHTALVTPGGFVPIRHAVVPQPFCSRPDFYAAGQQCALSSPDDVATAMEALLKMTAGQRRAQAAIASATIRQRFGLAACAPRLRAALAARDELAADEQVADRDIPAGAGQPPRPARHG